MTPLHSDFSLYPAPATIWTLGNQLPKRGVLLLNSKCCRLLRWSFHGSCAGTSSVAGAKRGWGWCGRDSHNHGSGLRLSNSSALSRLFGLFCRFAFVRTSGPFCFLTPPGFSGVAVAIPSWTGDRNAGYGDLWCGGGSDGNARGSTSRGRG